MEESHRKLLSVTGEGHSSTVTPAAAEPSSGLGTGHSKNCREAGKALWWLAASAAAFSSLFAVPPKSELARSGHSSSVFRFAKRHTML